MVNLSWDLTLPALNNEPVGIGGTSRAPLLMRLDGWTWNAAATVSGSPVPSRANFPIRRGDNWQIGFIQNVVSQQGSFQYEGLRNPVACNLNTQLLDALRPGTQAWLTPTAQFAARDESIQTWCSFTYDPPQSPAMTRLTMRDFPLDTYYMSFQNNGVNFLRSFRQTTTFRLWLAAKPGNAPEDQAVSYRLLAVADFAVTVQVTLTGQNPFTAHLARANFAAGGPSVPPGSFDVEVSPLIVNWRRGRDSGERRGADARGDRIVVSGHTANETYGAVFAGAGVGPATVAEGTLFLPPSGLSR
jgi:hypothetical protein